MTFYWLTILHSIAASIVIAAIILEVFDFFDHTSDKKTVVFARRFLLLPALMFQLISGVILVKLKPYSYHDWWLMAGITGYIVLAILLHLRKMTLFKKNPASFLSLTIILLLMILYCMIVRPS